MNEIHPVNTALLVGAGGSLGALARYYVSVGMTRWLGAGWPFGTFTVNILGCLALGAMSALALREAVHPAVKALVMVGFLGAFTTFSTFSYETLKLWREASTLWPGTTYAVGSVLLGLVAAYAGFRLVPAG